MLNDDKISNFILKNIYELIRFISFEDKPVDTLIKEAFQEFEFQMSQNDELTEEERDNID